MTDHDGWTRDTAPPEEGSRPLGGPPAPQANEPRLTPEGATDPAWPCRTPPEARSERLVAFLYILLRQGATCPAEVEQAALNVGQSPHDESPVYTNVHLESYARALATFLTPAGDGVVLSDEEAATAYRFIQGDHFDSKVVDGFMPRLEAAYFRTINSDDDPE